MAETGEPLRVLIVEDTAERQDVLTSLFRAHAWVLVDSSHRAIRLLDAYDFDLISLDFNIKGDDDGDAVATAITRSRNRDTKVVVHSMNPRGAATLAELLPDAVQLPVSKMIRTNAGFRRLRDGLDEHGAAFDWRLNPR